MIHFEHIKDKQRLCELYYLIEEGSSRIQHRSQLTVFAPDIYHAVMSGKAEIVIGFRDGEPKGYFTCYVVPQPCGRDNLHVWHGYIRPGDPADGLVAAFDEISKVAKEKNCQQVVFGTRRKGWAKVAARVGMSLQEYSFSKVV